MFNNGIDYTISDTLNSTSMNNVKFIYDNDYKGAYITKIHNQEMYYLTVINNDNVVFLNYKIKDLNNYLIISKDEHIKNYFIDSNNKLKYKLQLFKFYNRNNIDITRNLSIYGETGNMPFYILDNSKYCDSSCEIRPGQKYILDDSLDANVPTVPYGTSVNNLEDAIDKCIKNPNCSQMVINTKTNKVYPMSKITKIDPNKYVRRQYNANIKEVTILDPDTNGKLIKIENPSDDYKIKAGDYISFNQILKYDSNTKEAPC